MRMMQENSRSILDTESTDQIIGKARLLSADHLSGAYISGRMGKSVLQVCCYVVS